MRGLIPALIIVLGCVFFSDSSLAQVTTVYPIPPATKLESFETNTDVVILKTTTAVGSVASNNGEVAIKCREVTDTSTSNKEQGLAIELVQNGQPKATMLIDYDELPSLVNAISYLSKLDMSATSLNFLDATYTTKGGFRLAALASRRTGLLDFVVRDSRTGMAPMILAREQMPQFAGLINQAKKNLDSLRGG